MTGLRFLQLVLLLLLVIHSGRAQDNPVHLSLHQYEQLQRLSAKYPMEESFFPSFHTMSRKEIADFVMKLPFDSMSSHALDAVRYMMNELPEWFTDTSFLAAYEDLVAPGSSIVVPKKKYPWLNTCYAYTGNIL